ncbi:MAG: restriction endonuclease subunit S [Tannerella sp.]|jgi:restriction endonuclease S subunit|nr:restriction endonuclease subunit S [Tannerella sp.]
MMVDKSKWKIYRFEEFAQNISQRVDPKSTDLSIFVGLEHIDPDCLHIKQYGYPSDVEGTKLKFYKGDVIFGKRRAYLRKTALAEYDGICSAHAMVLRAKTDVIDEKFFPFLFQSKIFQACAIDISVGGLSPTINWKDIAKQEFLLPPKKEQARLAELLWAADEVVEREKEVKERLDNAYKSFVFSIMNGEYNSIKKKLITMYSPYQTKKIQKKVPDNWNIYCLADIMLKTQSGFAEGQRDDEGIIQLRMNNVTKDCRFDKTAITRVPINKIAKTYYIETGDVLFNNTNSPELVGKSVIFEKINEPMVFSNHFTKLCPNSNFLTNRFLYLWLVYNYSIGLFERRCIRWVGQAAVQAENLLSLHILVPSLSDQKDIEIITKNIEYNIEDITKQIDRSQQLKSVLINKIF